MKSTKKIILVVASLLMIFTGDSFSKTDSGLGLSLKASTFTSLAIAQTTQCPEDDPQCIICGDEWACNYDQIGECDYSCDCLDPSACNYRDKSGSCEYQSCIPKTKVCGDPNADNFVAVLNPGEEYDDSVCLYYVRGCGIQNCRNYDILTKKSVNDGGHIADNEMCLYWHVCNTEKDSNGVPYQNYQESLGSCDEADSAECIAGVLGCMTVGDPNYNANATYDDGTQCAGSCPITTSVCCIPTSPSGDPYINYIPTNNLQECDVCLPSVCRTTNTVSGCTDELAVNYNSKATVNDNSCIYNWCKYEVTFEKEDLQYNPSDPTSLYTISMDIKVLLSDYGLPSGAHPSACEDLLNNKGEELEADLNDLISIVEDLPIVDMTCSTCSNLIVTNIPDLCLKIDGIDDPANQTSVPEGYNRQSDGNCYSNTTNAVYCGTASSPNMTFMNTTDISADQKCNPTNSSSTSVTRKTQSPTIFQWTCSNATSTASCTAKSYCSADNMTLCDGICISSPNTCNDNDCVSNGGVQCGNICLKDGSSCTDIPNPTFIDNVKVNPKVIRDDNDKCIVTWNTIKSSDTDVITCNFDSNSTGVNEISANSWKKTEVNAGDHKISCTLTTESGTSINDSSIARCSQNPKFIEF